MEGSKISILQPPWKNRDLISRLPDDIIVSILLRLTLKEAVRTCVLSRRWEKLWRLRFGNDIVFCDDRSPKRFLESPRDFVAWVGRILKSSSEQPVNEFVIRFKLNSHFSYAINSWIAFALRKNVKRLHLDLVPPEQFNPFLQVHPDQFDPSFCVFPDLRKLPSLIPVYSSLKDVYLCGFKVDQIAFQYFLFKCQSLERLCLQRLHGAKCVNVASQTLKRLQVIRCLDLEIVVSAPNLMSLDYDGDEKGLQLGSVPLLSEFFIGGICIEFFAKQFAKDFRFASQLTTLKLELCLQVNYELSVFDSPFLPLSNNAALFYIGVLCQIVEESMSYPQEFTVFSVLKYFEITMSLGEHNCLLWPICLIKAAPLLHKFKVEMKSWRTMGSIWYLRSGGKCVKGGHNCNGRNLRNVETVGHKSLKVVEFCGFSNFRNQWELVIEILKIPQSLEKMVLDIDANDGNECDGILHVIYAKAGAKSLLAPGTKLEVRNSSIKRS